MQGPGTRVVGEDHLADAHAPRNRLNSTKGPQVGLDPWDADAAAIADVAIYPILTLDAAKWRQPSADLDEPPQPS